MKTQLLDVYGTRFQGDAYFNLARIESYAQAVRAEFWGMANFQKLQAQDFDAPGAKFAGRARFFGTVVTGTLNLDCSEFRKHVTFADARIGKMLNLYDTRLGFEGSPIELPKDSHDAVDLHSVRASTVRLGKTRAPFGLTLRGARVEVLSLVNAASNHLDLEGAEIDDIRLDGVTLDANSELTPPCPRAQRGAENWAFCTQGLVFKRMSNFGTNEGVLELLDSNAPPNFEPYGFLDAGLRNAGDVDAANAAFIAGKRRAPFGWALSVVSGREHPLVYLGACVVVIAFGLYFFREKKMERTEEGRGPYYAFWYSLDLFLPGFIDFSYQKRWRRIPKADHHWYPFVHQLLGWILVSLFVFAVTSYIR